MLHSEIFYPNDEYFYYSLRRPGKPLSVLKVESILVKWAWAVCLGKEDKQTNHFVFGVGFLL
jgi:hypothetical protein